MEELDDNCMEFKIYFHEETKEEFYYKKAEFLTELIPKEYIWNVAPLKMSFKELPLPHIYGFLEFGDCMDDEWFTASILFEFSKKEKQAVITIQDNDGEFLLIEAAHTIPRWLDPDNSENRIFVNRGQLCIIPVPCSSSEPLPLGKPNLKDAIKIISDQQSRKQCVASTEVQHKIQKRFTIEPNSHLGECFLPNKIVSLLHFNPQLISSAVDAFFTRDPISLRACNKMENFDPQTCIKTSVQMTKIMYAKVVSQQFVPPKPFKLPNKENESFAAAELGMKIACGFEILATDKLYKKTSQGIKPPVYLSKEFIEKYFLQGVSISLADQVSKEHQFDASHVNKEMPDSDNWMYVDPEQFEEYLGDKTNPDEYFEKTTKSIKDFMKAESGFGGISEDEDDGFFDEKEDSNSEGDFSQDMLEAIYNDPDLLMKIIEKDQAMGRDSKDLLEKLQEYSANLKESDLDEDDYYEDDEEEMDQEFLTKLKSGLGNMKDDPQGSFTMLSNLMKSMNMEGDSGPASNLFKSMGIKIPKKEQEK